MGLISGQWGTGKTFLALDLAGSVMTGARFAGHRVKRPGGVLFVAAEAAGDIPIRLAALVDHKLAGERQGDLLRPTPTQVARLPFAWIDTCHEPSPARDGETVAEYLARRQKEALRTLAADHAAGHIAFEEAND